jgi:hypothetical protein
MIERHHQRPDDVIESGTLHGRDHHRRRRARIAFLVLQAMVENEQDQPPAGDGGLFEESYWIVACTVITDVPEAVGPLPVALMAKVSLPLYRAFAVYS